MKMYSFAISIPLVHSPQQQKALSRVLSDRRLISYFRTVENPECPPAAVEHYLIRYSQKRKLRP